MKTPKQTAILAAIILSAAGFAKETEKPAKVEISNTRTASCLVKITTDPTVLPLSFKAIEYLLWSSGVGGKAVREALDRPPDEALDLISVEPLSAGPSCLPAEASRTSVGGGRYGAPHEENDGQRADRGSSHRAAEYVPMFTRETAAATLTGAGEQTLLFRLQVGFGEDVKPAAQECLNATTENLRLALTRGFDESRGRTLGQQKLAERELNRVRGDFEAHQRFLKEIRTTAGDRDISRQRVLDDIARVQRELRALGIEVQSNEVTAKAITKQIIETEAKARDRLKDNPITDELQKLVEHLDKSAARTRKLLEEGRVTLAELDEVITKLTKAKAELAQQREQMRKSGGGDLIDSLNRRLSDVMIEAEGANARAKALEGQLAELKSLLGAADQFEEVSFKTEMVKRNLEEATLLRDQLSRRANLLQPPTVTVIGAD